MVMCSVCLLCTSMVSGLSSCAISAGGPSVASTSTLVLIYWGRDGGGGGEREGGGGRGGGKEGGRGRRGEGRKDGGIEIRYCLRWFPLLLPSPLSPSP